MSSKVVLQRCMFCIRCAVRLMLPPYVHKAKRRSTTCSLPEKESTATGCHLEPDCDRTRRLKCWAHNWLTVHMTNWVLRIGWYDMFCFSRRVDEFAYPACKAACKAWCPFPVPGRQMCLWPNIFWCPRWATDSLPGFSYSSSPAWDPRRLGSSRLGWSLWNRFAWHPCWSKEWFM